MVNPEDMINQCVMMLQVIIEDNSIPRNIRKVSDETRKILMDETKEISDRAASALSTIDEVSNDSNMPMHARTKMWEIVSALEAIPLS